MKTKSDSPKKAGFSQSKQDKPSHNKPFKQSAAPAKPGKSRANAVSATTGALPGTAAAGPVGAEARSGQAKAKPDQADQRPSRSDSAPRSKGRVQEPRFWEVKSSTTPAASGKGSGSKAAGKAERVDRATGRQGTGPGAAPTDTHAVSRTQRTAAAAAGTGTATAAATKKGSPKPAAPSHRIAPAEHRPQHQPKHVQGGERPPKLHSGQTLELNISSTTNEGFGVAQHEGTRVLVAGGIPGEQLLTKITYVGRRESFAKTLRCVKASPDREPSPACHMGKCCDGCGLMQMRYPAQLAWKKGLVTRELHKYPSLGEVPVSDTIGSPKELNYRNSAKLVVAGKFTDPVIGIYRRNTHDVLEIYDCPLHHPLINKVVKATKAGIKKGKVPVYNPKSEMGLLRYLVVRVAEPSDKVMVVFVTSEEGYNEIHHLAKFVQQAVPEVVVVAQNINASTGNVIFGHKERFLTKATTLRARLGEKSFALSPHSFFQVNSGAAQIIYEKVRELARLTGKERVIDLYCGIGGISIFLADQAREVVGIEFVETAVADATQNAALNKADNCEFEAGDAAHLLDEIGEEGGADVIVLNPPRKGCDEKVLRSVAAIKPSRIVYVSCSPDTLARDLDIMSRMGYRTRQVHPVDMFPQTVHVEDVALLERMEE